MIKNKYLIKYIEKENKKIKDKKSKKDKK